VTYNPHFNVTIIQRNNSKMVQHFTMADK